MIPKEQIGSGIIGLNGSPLDDASTAIAQINMDGGGTDSSPNGLDMIDVGLPAYGVIGSGTGMTDPLARLTAATQRQGWMNPASGIRLQGDGTGTYAALRLEAALTLDCWIKPNNITGFKTICQQGNLGAGIGVFYWLQMEGSELRYITSAGGVIQSDVTSSGLGLVAGIWQKVGLTRNAPATDIGWWRNGELKDTASGITPGSDGASGIFCLGATVAGALPFGGELAGCRVADSERNADQMLAGWARGALGF